MRRPCRPIGAGRKLHEHPPEIHEVLILISLGPPEGECPRAVTAANYAKSQGVLFITVCTGVACDAQCMRMMASSPRYFSQLRNLSELARAFQPFRDHRLDVVARELTLTATLGADMRLLADQRDQHLVVADPLEGLVVWTTVGVPREGSTYTVGVEPLSPGTQPLFEGAKGEILDLRSRCRAFDVLPPHTTVLQPMRLPRPEPTR